MKRIQVVRMGCPSCGREPISAVVFKSRGHRIDMTNHSEISAEKEQNASELESNTG